MCRGPVADARSYLERDLTFLHDRIVVADTGEQVMMVWEQPLMKRMGEIAAMRRGDVLEVGFGMGLSAAAIAAQGPRSHTIIEAHPQIAARAREWAEDRERVRILEGRWQDRIHELDTFDGVAFDVFGGEAQREKFFGSLGRLLRPRGVATLWLADDRELPSALAQVLIDQGFRFHLVPVAAIPDPSCTYSRTDRFYLPIITR